MQSSTGASTRTIAGSASTHSAPRFPDSSSDRLTQTGRPLLALTFLVFVLFASTGSALAEIEVNSTAWGNDGVAATCTLWEAITTVEGMASSGGCSWTGSRVINLEAGATYTTLGQLPNITGELRIWGHGATLYRDPAAPASRFLTLAGSGADVSVNHLTLRGGDHPYGGAVNVGWGSTFAGSRLRFEDNNGNLGGAIYGRGEVSIINSTFDSNTAVRGGGVHATFGTITVFDSTFVRNDASFKGGAIHASVHVDQIAIRNSTFSENEALRGGAIYRSGLGTPNPDTVKQVTFKGNRISRFGSGNTLYLEAPTNLILEKSALHSDDSTSSLCAGDLSGLTSLGHNAATDASCALTHTEDHPAVNFLLSDLERAGAFTEVHIPRCDAQGSDPFLCSILMDQYPCVNESGGLDQRGMHRWNYGDGPFNPAPRCDIGAYESICDSYYPTSNGVSILTHTDQFVHDGRILNNGDCAGLGQAIEVPDNPTADAEINWVVYGPGLAIEAIWFLEETCSLDCFVEPERCKNECTVDPNDWRNNLPLGLEEPVGGASINSLVFRLIAPASAPAVSRRYVMEFTETSGGGIKHWDPDMEINSRIPTVP